MIMQLHKKVIQGKVAKTGPAKTRAAGLILPALLYPGKKSKKYRISILPSTMPWLI